MSVRLSIKKRFRGNMIFSAPIQDKSLNFGEYLSIQRASNLIIILFVCVSVITLLLMDFFIPFLNSAKFLFYLCKQNSNSLCLSLFFLSFGKFFLGHFYFRWIMFCLRLNWPTYALFPNGLEGDWLVPWTL